jgi:steroid 5-alpha reductase family enzyme
VPFIYCLQARYLADHPQVGATTPWIEDSHCCMPACKDATPALHRTVISCPVCEAIIRIPAQLTVALSPLQTLSWLAVNGVLLVKAAGYLTFRGSNSQKDLFRRDPSHPRVRGLQTIRTETGRQLLVSGWWGIARHINYFGDWLMA